MSTVTCCVCDTPGYLVKFIGITVTDNQQFLGRLKFLYFTRLLLPLLKLNIHLLVSCESPRAKTQHLGAFGVQRYLQNLKKVRVEKIQDR